MNSLPGTWSAQVDVGQLTEHALHRRFVRASVVWGLLTFFSRAAGFAREVLLARAFGTSVAASTIVVAQTVPNLSRTLLSEEVSRGAVLPLLTEELVSEDEAEAWRLTTATAAWSSLITVALAALAWLTASWSVRRIAPGLATENGNFSGQAAEVLRILLPLIVCSGVAASSSAFLLAKRRFGVAGTAMAAANVPLVGTLLFVRHPSVDLAAALISAGAVLQAAMQVAGALRARKAGRFAWRARRLLAAGKLAFPVVLTLGAASFSGLVDVAFASTVGTGGPAAFDKAFRLVLVPYGVFAVAIGVVALPSLVEAALKKNGEFDAELVRATRLQATLLLPSALMIGLAATPIVSVIYERGAFGEASTRLTANALIGLAFVLPAMGLSLIGSRAWLSRKRPWPPALLWLVGIFLNGVLDWLLVRPLGLLGIGVSTAVVHGLLGVCLILGAASDRRFALRQLGSFAARLAAANSASATAGLAVVPAVASSVGSIAAAAFGVAAAGSVLLVAASVVRLDDYTVIGASLLPVARRRWRR
jgi:putative peptidoglycan lipid II flippase